MTYGRNTHITAEMNQKLRKKHHFIEQELSVLSQIKFGLL